MAETEAKTEAGARFGETATLTASSEEVIDWIQSRTTRYWQPDVSRA